LTRGRRIWVTEGVGEGEIHLSEVVAGLSYALDLTEGEPRGHATRSCVIGMRIAEEIGLDPAARSDLFYALLIKDAGCSANSSRMAALFGADDLLAKRTSKRVDWARALPAAIWALRTTGRGGSLRSRVGRLSALRGEQEITRMLMQARCDRGAEIARLLGLSDRTAEAIRALDEHWDGRGQPRGLRGEAIPLAARILCLAQTVEVFHAIGGLADALRVARSRRGTWFDPALVDALHATARDPRFWSELPLADVTAWEPRGHVLSVDETRLDGIAEAFAGVIDAKSPWTYRHSDRTCVIAMSLAAMLGASDPAVAEIRRAALLHDVGKLAISNRILDKPGGLTEAEFARVRQHPAITAQVLGRVPGFDRLVPLASAHHERLDGRGYPDGLAGDQLTTPMRVLAVADVYEALTAERPYRAAMTSAQALAVMRRDVPGRLDGEVFAALEALLRDGPGVAAQAERLLPQRR
jgi:HD-GYP domain-containing protein (c-di-GMP phosphodiesterase class II)